MSCITRGRSEPCRDNVGGIRAVYLMDFVQYPYNLLLSGRTGTANDFPQNTLYKYECQNANFTETANITDDGISYDQKLSFTLFKIDAETSVELNKVVRTRFRFIVEYNDGTARIGGYLNGSSLDSLSIESGTAKGEFKGYNISVSGMEDFPAPFVDLTDALTADLLLLEDSFYILLEDGNKIILE